VDSAQDPRSETSDAALISFIYQGRAA